MSVTIHAPTPIVVWSLFEDNNSLSIPEIELVYDLNISSLVNFPNLQTTIEYESIWSFDTSVPCKMLFEADYDEDDWELTINRIEIKYKDKETYEIKKTQTHYFTGDKTRDRKAAVTYLRRKN